MEAEEGVAVVAVAVAVAAAAVAAIEAAVAQDNLDIEENKSIMWFFLIFFRTLYPILCTVNLIILINKHPSVYDCFATLPNNS